MHRVGLLALLLGAAASANSAGGHKHGVGNIYLATEGNNLQLQLVLPADELPLNSMATLLSASPLTIASDYRCVMQPAKIDRLSDHEQEDSFADSSANSHHHSHDEHDEPEGHSDVSVNYVWQCSKPVNLVTVTLFQRIASLEKINVQIVSPQYQGAQVLTPTSTELKWPR